MSPLHHIWKRSRILLVAVAFALAQLGIAVHTHTAAAKPDGQNGGQTVELSCAFCLAATHLHAGPSSPFFQVARGAAIVVDVAVRHVCGVRSLLSPRLTRGPPRSTACI
jgi:hypothetical protein